MNPYVIRTHGSTVEIWSGKRIQHGDEARSDWQRALKSDVREAFTQLHAADGAILAGHYNSTSPVKTDTENSLYTNMAETIPRAFTTLRFERGIGAPQPPPEPIEPISGHLHYYRYAVDQAWTAWEPDRMLARWSHVPRRLAVGTDTARPVWFALRQANARGVVWVSRDCMLQPEENFGIRVVVHTAKGRSHKAISNSEFVIDGVIAAFHGDSPSNELIAAMLPKLPSVTEAELCEVLGRLAGPVFPTPAVEIALNGAVRLNPADERCWLGEYTVRQDSTSQWPEVSGELFSLRPASGDSPR